MKISLKWLNEYVPVEPYYNKPEELGKLLTAAGLEVEATLALGKALDKVVVGRIIELGRHPNADRLTVCQVDAGEGKTRQIVCGAKNHKQGDVVVVALPGAVLPGDFAIKESKIRDVESRGMLCSEVELGLKKESDGIMILPKDAPVGDSFAKYFGLDDVVLELNVTPNRADCLSHLGLAREVRSILGLEVCAPKPKFVSGSVSTAATIHLDVRDQIACPRYAGRVIKGVKVGPSPDWLKQRLQAVGVNSINNVVDVTNYVMFEMGQPLHAFDTRSLKGKKIIVDRAKAGEAFTSFDGSELKLKGDELTIRDADRPVALAGIVGGKNSGVESDTTELFIESAHFAADSVRRTMRRLGIQTDSAYRFSRGTDPSGVVVALERACELIQKVAGGEIAKDFHDFYPKPHSAPVIAVSLSYVSERLGYVVSETDFIDVMERLGAKVKSVGAGRLEVTAPLYRGDLLAPVDLVEEIGRLMGYERIPETFPALTTAPLLNAPEFERDQRLIDLAAQCGFQQAVNYGFTSSHWQAEVMRPAGAWTGLEMAEVGVRIKNPLNQDLDEMRVSLLPGLIKNLTHNYRQSNDSGRLFELGQVFAKSVEGYAEQTRISFLGWGHGLDLWQRTDRPVVFDLKSAIEEILERLGVASYQWQPADNVPDILHPAQAIALVCEGRPVGLLGSLHPAWLEKEKIRVSAAVAELDVFKLMRGQPRQPKVQAFSRFPPVARDIALILPDSILAADVVKEIKKAAGPLLKSVTVFDVFKGGQLTAGEKSVAFRLILQDDKGTLTDEKINQVQADVLKQVSQKLKLAVRG